MQAARREGETGGVEAGIAGSSGSRPAAAACRLARQTALDVAGQLGLASAVAVVVGAAVAVAVAVKASERARCLCTSTTEPARERERERRGGKCVVGRPLFKVSALA